MACGAGVKLTPLENGDRFGRRLDGRGARVARRAFAKHAAQLRPAPSSGSRNLPSMNSSTVDGGHLKAFIERIEKLEEERRAIADDIKDVYGEAKGTGFDPKIMRKIVSLRRQDKGRRREEAEILDLYLEALGME